MIYSLYAVAILGLAIGLGAQTSGSHLEGCPDLSVLAKALGEIGQMRWRDLSMERVRAMWPTELTGFFDPHLRIDLTKSCATGGGCLTKIWSDGRVIRGYRQCGEEFGLLLDRKENGSVTERLYSIQIDYSLRTRNEVVTAARAFAGATGLPEAKIATIGRDPQQDRGQEFWWDTASRLDVSSSEYHSQLQKGKMLELSGLTVRFFDRGSLWKLWFHWSRDPI